MVLLELLRVCCTLLLLLDLRMNLLLMLRRVHYAPTSSAPHGLERVVELRGHPTL